MTGKAQLKMALRSEQRLALFGRLRMAEWIEMPEREFARQIERIESDPLFKKLSLGTGAEAGIIRRQRWPNGQFSSGFYEMNEKVLAGGERVKVEELLGEDAALIPKIRKMGPEAFERYFLYAEEALPIGEIARRTGLTLKQAERVNGLLLKVGAQAEFAPRRGPQPRGSYACLARLSVDGSEPGFEFFSPYWARGLYQIRYDLLEKWKDEGRLPGGELKRLPHLLKKLETINLRQNTVFRILESLAKLQARYLRSRREDFKLPLSLRMLAHRLDLAPSTVSRAVSGRSVRLPWDKETPLISLMPGRRRVLKEVLSRWLAEDARRTDAHFVEKLKAEYGIRISRRTVNSVRNELGGGRQAQGEVHA